MKLLVNNKLGINEDLKEYLQKFLNQHKSYDNTGAIYNHVRDVIRRSLLYGNEYTKEKLNLNMILAIAALHDLGFKFGRKDHNINSVKMIKDDKKLKSFFSPVEFQIILDAIEDHKSSAGRTPRSIYGYLIKEADRDDPKTLDEILSNSIKMNLFDNPEKTDKELSDIIWNVHNGRYKTLHFDVPSSRKNHRNLNSFFKNEDSVKRRILELLEKFRNSKEFKVSVYKKMMG